MASARGGIEFLGNLRVQYPELSFQSGCFLDGERRTPRHFRHQVDVVVGLLQQRADFVSERGFADAVRANQGKFQGLGYLDGIFSNTIVTRPQSANSNKKLNLWISGGSG
jgi:hypothetical protein